MIQCIGVELGLQAYAATATIGNTALAGLALQKITGIQLNAGAIGGHRHGSAGIRIA